MSIWGFETLTLFRTKKTLKVNTPSIQDNNLNFNQTPFRIKDQMHAVLFFKPFIGNSNRANLCCGHKILYKSTVQAIPCLYLGQIRVKLYIYFVKNRLALSYIPFLRNHTLAFGTTRIGHIREYTHCCLSFPRRRRSYGSPKNAYVWLARSRYFFSSHNILSPRSYVTTFASKNLFKKSWIYVLSLIIPSLHLRP